MAKSMEEMYKKAILLNSILFFEVNLSKDIVTKPIQVITESSVKLPQPEDFGMSVPYKFSELCQKIRNRFIPNDNENDTHFFDHPTEHLIAAYEKGKSNFSIDYWVGENGEKTTFIDQLFLLDKNEDGDICALIVLRDQSKIQRIFEENHRMEMEQCAFYDPITQGYNYFKFKEILHKNTIPGTIVVIDIHSFKIINSICGIAKGDAVIKRVWEEISAQLDFDKNELAAHINADHFILFFPTYDAEVILEKIKILTEKINAASTELHVPILQPYFGISEWHPGKKVELSNSEAVAAKHAAKTQLEENYAFFDKRDNIKLIKEKKITDAFDDAMKNEEFKVWFQPKYNPLTKRMIGAEALIRWEQGDGSMLPPARFIPIFEQNGMIRILDEYVFRKVCELQKKWRSEGKRLVPISVNISRASLYSKEVVFQYKKIAEEIQIDPKLVPIEITETATVDNSKIKDIADNFYLSGFPLHIDDFGSGYSTLSSLNVMHFETLKIDTSLIDFIGNYGGDRVIEHTICLAQELGMQVTAEGVENELQEKFLKHTGCDSIQGYFYSKPISLEEFEKKLESFCALPAHKTMDLVAEHIIEHRKSFIKSSLYTFLINLTQNYVNQDSGICDWLVDTNKTGSFDEVVRDLAENYVIEEDRNSYLEFLNREKLLKSYNGKEETRILHYSRFLNKNPTKMRLLLNIFKVERSEELWAYATVTQL